MAYRHYPAFLDLRGRRALVVGGGAIAAHKARALARCGAEVVVVAPRLSRGARAWAEVSIRREFLPRDLEGAHLVVSAADDEAVNRRVAFLCRRRGIWANIVDRPALCGFIAPAVFRRGALCLAVSTGGASPALAKRLRRRLESFITPEDARLARRLARRRPGLLRMDLRARRRALKTALAGAP